MHESPNGYRPGTGFTNFVQRTLQGKPGHLNLHTRPQRNMCLLPGIAPWDWTLKLEEIAPDATASLLTPLLPRHRH